MQNSIQRFQQIILQNTRFQNDDEGKRYLIENLTKVSA